MTFVATGEQRPAYRSVAVPQIERILRKVTVNTHNIVVT